MKREEFLKKWIRVTKDEYIKFYSYMGGYHNIFGWYRVHFKNAIHSFNPITAVYFFKRNEKKFLNQFQTYEAGKKLGLSRQDIKIIDAATRREYDKLRRSEKKEAKKLREQMKKYCHQTKRIHQKVKEIPRGERREEKEEEQKAKSRKKAHKKRDHRKDRRKNEHRKEKGHKVHRKHE